MTALIPENMKRSTGHPVRQCLHTVLEAVSKTSLRGVKRKHRIHIYDLQPKLIFCISIFFLRYFMRTIVKEV